MRSKYKADEISKYTTYFDANNLYGFALSKPPLTH